MKTTTHEDAIIPYDDDFAAWAEQQAAFVLAGDWSRVDSANVNEELAALAARDKREIRKRLTRLFEHAIKLRALPSDDAANQWRGSVRKQRNGISDLLVQSASLVEEVSSGLRVSLARARDIVRDKYGLATDFDLDDARKYLIAVLLERRDESNPADIKKLLSCVDKLMHDFDIIA